jgi:hypothetical protein
MLDLDNPAQIFTRFRQAHARREAARRRLSKAQREWIVEDRSFAAAAAAAVAILGRKKR